MNATIRDYRKEDLERIMAVWYEASRVGHPFLSEEALEKDRREIVDKYIPVARQWVCEADGLVVGFIALLDDFIGGLFVDPAWHGRGIGSRLIGHVQSRFDSLTVKVFRQNEKAVAFYESRGFYRVEEQTCEHTGLPAFVYRLDNPRQSV